MVGHGLEPIPPTGWGAVEHVIWEYAQRLQARGHRVRIVNERRWKAIFSVVVRQLRRRADVVHVHAEKPIAVLARLAGLLRFRLISTLHVPMQRELERYQLKALDRVAPAPFHLLIRPDTESRVRERNPSAEFAILPNGVEVDKFAIHERGNGRGIYVGRIQERKRQNEVAEAFVGSEVGLDFVGPARNEVVVSGALKERWLGEWERPVLHGRLGEYSALVLFSHSEGMPLVVLEALAAGIPVVISEECAANLDPALPFVYAAARLEELPDLLARAIRENEGRRDEIREYARLHFDYEAVIDRYESILRGWLDRA